MGGGGGKPTQISYDDVKRGFKAIETLSFPVGMLQLSTKVNREGAPFHV